MTYVYLMCMSIIIRTTYFSGIKKLLVQISIYMHQNVKNNLSPIQFTIKEGSTHLKNYIYINHSVNGINNQIIQYH